MAALFDAFHNKFNSKDTTQQMIPLKMENFRFKKLEIPGQMKVEGNGKYQSQYR